MTLQTVRHIFLLLLFVFFFHLCFVLPFLYTIGEKTRNADHVVKMVIVYMYVYHVYKNLQTCSNTFFKLHDIFPKMFDHLKKCMDIFPYMMNNFLIYNEHFFYTKNLIKYKMNSF